MFTSPAEACGADLHVGCCWISAEGLHKVKDAGFADRRAIEDKKRDKARHRHGDIIWLPQSSIDSGSHDIVEVTKGRRTAAVA